MASISKRRTSRGTVWDVAVSLGRDPNGKQVIRRKTITPISDTPRGIAAEVRKAAERLEAELKHGRPTERTFSEFYQKDWKIYAAGHLTEYQLHLYESALNRIWIPVVGQYPLCEITPIQIQAVIDKMTAYGSATKKRYLTALRSVLSYAADLALIQDDPCRRIKVPIQNTNARLHYWTASQCALFLNRLKTGLTYRDKLGRNYNVKVPLHWQTFFSLAIYGSFRRAEIVALRWDDIDLSAGTVHIHRSIMRTSKGCIEKETKTRSGDRIIKLPRACLDILRNYQAHTGKTSGLLFSQSGIHRGKFIEVTHPSKKFKTYVKMINASVCDPSERLPEITLHDLRHTGATLMVAAGVDIETVSHRLGHSRASVTLDVYAEAMKEKDSLAATAVDHAFETS